MTLDLAAGAAFLLVLARTSAWAMAAPVFSARGLSGVGRLALALALALFVTPAAARTVAVPTGAVDFGLAVAGQVVVGLVIGWLTGLLFHAFEAAGGMVDLASGLSIGAVLDPMTGAPSPVFARFMNVLFLTVLVATNAHHVLIEGFVRSFAAVPAHRVPELSPAGALAAAEGVAGLMVAAAEVAAPILGALFLTEVALALAARFAPQANVFAIGLPAKTAVALGVTGAALVLLPSQVAGVVDRTLRLTRSFLG